MGLTEQQHAFLIEQTATPMMSNAAMLTVGADGRARAARVAIAFIDGKLWSSGSRTRARTRRLREDPRCTLFVYGGMRWLGVDTNVRIIDGPDVAELSLGYFRTIQFKPTGNLFWINQELTEEQFLETMIEDQRIIFEFELLRAYGDYD